MVDAAAAGNTERLPPHSYLPDQLNERQIATTPALFSGALLCPVDSHQWARRRSVERLSKLHDDLRQAQTASAGDVESQESSLRFRAHVQPTGLTEGPSSSGNSGGSPERIQPESASSIPFALLRWSKKLRHSDDVLVLWRLVQGVVIVFCLDAAVANVPLAKHSMSMIVQLLPDGLLYGANVKPESGRFVRASTVAKYPDVVDEVFEAVCPGGSLTPLDTPLARSTLATRLKR